MKIRFTLTIIFAIVFSSSLFAQTTTIKLFDAVPVDFTDQRMTFDTAVDFGTAEVYLSCPVGTNTVATLSGPNGGNFVVDNFMTLNDANICPGPDGQGSCFGGVLADPRDFLGDPMEVPYMSIPPIDISSLITGPGLYTFKIKDYGYTFGSSEIYLTTTSCSTVNQVCHRNNGSRGGKTLTVGASAVAAHLAHGDTAGPCS